MPVFLNSARELRARHRQARNDANGLLEDDLRFGGIIGFVREHHYAPHRQLRADFAWPAIRLLVEVQGGIYSRQAHGSASGIIADIDRLNAATLAGWRLLRVTPDMVADHRAVRLIQAALDGDDKAAAAIRPGAAPAPPGLPAMAASTSRRVPLTPAQRQLAELRGLLPRRRR